MIFIIDLNHDLNRCKSPI